MQKDIPFSKFHGTANDFIIVDHTQEQYILWDDKQLIKSMCNRRFGIGADGLMMIEKSTGDADFEMKYYNSDGNLSSMCGNGGRCISFAAKLLGLVENTAQFTFNGDTYYSTFIQDSQWVSLRMQDLMEISKDGEAFILDTGSPHYVSFHNDVSEMNIAELGSNIRNNDLYKSEGINVNFCSLENDILTVRTFERGVEDETYSCGTGVVASSIALCEYKSFDDGEHTVKIATLGGDLQVKLQKGNGVFTNILLQGPAVKVYDGIWRL